MLNYEITDNTELFKRAGDSAVDIALGRGATNILRKAKMDAPHDEGALQGSGEMRRIGNGSYEISFDTPYARRWEFNESFTDALGRHYNSVVFAQGKKDHYLSDAGREEFPNLAGYVVHELERV